ncbi:hypothetical protein [Pseudomonas typographi]|uniref:hypothetical protein n=1 Tax=Pseudomonas typographi TaxID=2715964 RepID=UPI001689BD34|nr:hypothetical protein [Pseudomonas typographi]
MQMKPKHAERLQEIAALPHLSPRSQLIIARRMARVYVAETEWGSSLLNAALRKAKAGLPFTEKRVAHLKEMREELRDDYGSSMVDLADWLYSVDRDITALYGFDGICDLLEVNPVHRAEVLEYAEDKSRAISAIAFVSGLEESASRQSGRHPADWKDGPLFNLFMRKFQQLMLDETNALPDPFAPGGPFYGVPTYHQHPDGTMVRATPALTVHDGADSKVVASRSGRRSKSESGAGATVSSINHNLTRQD